MLRRQLLPAALMVLTLTVLTGIAYPLAVLAVGQAAFPSQANGSVVTVDGNEVGSSLLGQNFADPRYFQPRPSAAGADGYDALASSASNLGPSNPRLIADCLPLAEGEGGPADCDPSTVPQRVAAYRTINGLAQGVAVPIDAVTASGSGLDPHISIANARLQAPRVARERHLPTEQVLALIDDHTADRPLGILGEPGVNVLTLNLALDGTRTE